MASTLQASPAESATAKRYPIFLAGEWVESDDLVSVINPYDGSVVGVTFNASADQLDQATTAAVDAFAVTSAMPTYDRAALLTRIADGLAARRDEVVRLI